MEIIAFEKMICLVFSFVMKKIMKLKQVNWNKICFVAKLCQAILIFKTILISLKIRKA